MSQKHAFLVTLFCPSFMDSGFTKIYKLNRFMELRKASIFIFLNFRILLLYYYYFLNVCLTANVRKLQRLCCDYASDSISCEQTSPRLEAPSCSPIWLIFKSKQEIMLLHCQNTSHCQGYTASDAEETIRWCLKDIIRNMFFLLSGMYAGISYKRKKQA